MAIALPEALVVFVAQAVLNSTVSAAIISGVFLVANGLMVQYFERQHHAGKERRFSRVRAVFLLNIVTGICAIVALVLVVVMFELNIVRTRTDRERAAQDSCILLRGLVLAAAPPKRAAKARAYIRATPLANCRSYAVRLITHP